MKGVAFDPSNYESCEVVRARFKHQTLLHDYLELQKVYLFTVFLLKDSFLGCHCLILFWVLVGLIVCFDIWYDSWCFLIFMQSNTYMILWSLCVCLRIDLLFSFKNYIKKNHFFFVNNWICYLIYVYPGFYGYKLCFCLLYLITNYLGQG